MNYDKACNILDLSYNFSEKELKHQYYSKALQFHPDKNNELDANLRFQEILEAYIFLNKYKDIYDDGMLEPDKDSYLNILEKFLNGILNKNIDVVQLLSLLNNKCSEISIELLDHFSKDTLLKLHKFVVLYSDILHINKEVIEKLEVLIKDYTKNDIIETIYPNLENLMNDEVYKLIVEDEVYYIPMWHNELVYEISNISKNLLIVQCEPELPEYITFDQYNNLYVNISTSIKNILNENCISIALGTKNYRIPISELYIKKYQRYTFKKQGISVINTKEIYNIDNRANIYIDICFTDMSVGEIPNPL